MADKLKYSTTQPTLPGLRTDDFVLGTGDGNYGPTSTTSYLNGFTAPEGGYVVYTLGLSNTPIGWVASNDAELIDISRHLGNTTLDIKTAKVYLAGLTDTWIFNSTPNNIVTDSLVFDMDIKNLTSYPDAETNVYDISGKGNDGELVNGVGRNSNGWLLFDGVDDYVLIPYDASMQPTTALTMEALLYINTVPGGWASVFQSPETNGAHTPNYFDWAIYIHSTGGLHTRINGISDGFGQGTTTKITFGKWAHVAITWDGSLNSYYIDGELVQTKSLSTTIAYNNNTDKLIGTNAAGYEEVDGGISNVKLYNRALSETEIKQNYYGGPIVTDGLVYNVDASNLVSYENGSPTAFSLTGDYPTDLYNGLSWGSSYGGAFTPDGTDDGLITPHQPDLSLDANSLEGWVWFDQHKNYGSLLVKGPGGSGNIFNYAFFFYTDSIKYGCGDGSAWQSVLINSSQVPTGRFHHIVGTYDLNVLKFYLNGVLMDEISISFPPYQNTNDLQVLQVPYNLDGKVGAARIYNRALTDAEVKQNFEAHRSRFGV